MISLIRADARNIPLADESVQCVVTSPPYWGLRDYGVAGQLGLERTPEEYIAQMVQVFREVKRVLRDDGTLWVNLGDSYASTGGHTDTACNERRGAYNLGNRPEHDCREFRARGNPGGIKPKDLVGIPWMLAFALRADGWYLRSDIIWSKPNPMPESVTDRPTKAHEYIFLLSKSERYYYDADAIAEEAIYCSEGRYKTPDGWDTTKGNGGHGTILRSGREKGKKPDKQRGHGRRHNGFNDRWDLMTVKEQCSGRRNKRDVWEISPQPFPEAHFATFPEELIKPCILAGCPAGGVVFDPFVGSGTTLLVARELQCNAVGLELNSAYLGIAKRRLSQEVLSFV